MCTLAGTIINDAMIKKHVFLIVIVSFEGAVLRSLRMLHTDAPPSGNNWVLPEVRLP